MPKETNYTKLSNERIKEIARNARHSPERRIIAWFYRGEVLKVLSNALENRADRVIIDGKQFNITYHDDIGRAFVSPSDGTFVPCASLTIERYLNEWESYEQAFRVTRLDASHS